MDIVDINLNDIEPISFNMSDAPSSSVSFGPGIELLMNDKKKNGAASASLDLGELDTIENDLKELSSSVNMNSSASSSSNTKTIGGIGGTIANMFGFGNKSESSSGHGVAPVETTDSRLGNATKESMGNAKTWDGFARFNDIPDKQAPVRNMSEKDKRMKKRAMIKKLEEWYDKGYIKNISHFNNDSAYEDVEEEYEAAKEDKLRRENVKMQGWWITTFVNSIEYMNSTFDPFGINLDGWSEKVGEDLDSYEDIFMELYDKYKGGKLSPELNLLLRLAFSAAVVNISNKALSSALPGANDMLRQSPELMKLFTGAAVSSMSQQSPGFGFANGLVNNPDEINSSYGPPPPAVETKNSGPVGRTMQFTQAPGRGDIDAARGAMFKEQGVDLGGGYASVNKPSMPIYTPSPASMPPPQQSGPAMSIPAYTSQPTVRPEMRGPQETDLDNIISGLKTKPVNIHETSSVQPDDSMISISSLKDLQNTNMPKSSRKKNRSDKTRISLDI